MCPRASRSATLSPLETLPRGLSKTRMRGSSRASSPRISRVRSLEPPSAKTNSSSPSKRWARIAATIGSMKRSSLRTGTRIEQSTGVAAHHVPSRNARQPGRLGLERVLAHVGDARLDVTCALGGVVEQAL